MEGIRERNRGFPCKRLRARSFHFKNDRVHIDVHAYPGDWTISTEGSTVGYNFIF